MRILVVDDYDKAREHLRILLSQAGYADVAMKASAEEALEYLGLGEAGPAGEVDLVLMDLSMDGMNGIEACRQIKASDRLRDVPVIMVTVSSDMESLDEAFAAGAMDYIVKPLQKVELLARIRSSIQLKREVDQRKEREERLVEITSQLKEANAVLRQRSYIDSLTDIANRRYFDQHFFIEWRRALRTGAVVTLFMIDIDHFKEFNDTYGHQVGDECLRRVATALKDMCRRPGDFVARYGGEEFAVILAGTGINGAERVAEGMRVAVENLRIPSLDSKMMAGITISVGIASMSPRQGDEPARLIAEADDALYQAKREGRNRVCYWPTGSALSQ